MTFEFCVEYSVDNDDGDEDVVVDVDDDDDGDVLRLE